jgi:hypothetical protein
MKMTPPFFERQRVTAVRVANAPAEKFEAAIRSPQPSRRDADHFFRFYNVQRPGCFHQKHYCKGVDNRDGILYYVTRIRLFVAI